MAPTIGDILFIDTNVFLTATELSFYLRDLPDFDCGMTKAWPRSLRW